MQSTQFFNRAVASVVAYEDSLTTMQRKAAADAAAAAQQQVAATQLMPELFARDTAFSPALLKSALFRCTERGPRARHMQDYPLMSADGDQITYSGEELRQDDQTVLLALIKACAGELISSEMRFSPRAMVREVLGWPDKGASVERLGECLRRLKGASIKVQYAKGGEGTLSFVSDYDMKPGQWSVWLAPRLLGLFAKQTTYLNVEDRRGLTGLTSWLFGFVNADACNRAFEVDALHQWSGSPSDGRVFVRALRDSLAELKAIGLLESFDITRGRVRIVRAAR